MLAFLCSNVIGATKSYLQYVEGLYSAHLAKQIAATVQAAVMSRGLHCCDVMDSWTLTLASMRPGRLCAAAEALHFDAHALLVFKVC